MQSILVLGRLPRSAHRRESKSAIPYRQLGSGNLRGGVLEILKRLSDLKLLEDSREGIYARECQCAFPFLCFQ